MGPEDEAVFRVPPYGEVYGAEASRDDLAESTPYDVTANLAITTIADFLSEPDDDPGWLAKPIIPADSYGVLGTMFKVGKTWMVADLAVSVASGGRWCNVWPTPARRVLVFFSEGGRRKILRRLRAVAGHKGVDLAGLPLRLSLVPPLITDTPTLVAMEHEIRTERPGLIVIDPWYLSAPGVRMADLVNVGAALRELQLLCQRNGAALILTHHWNQTGQGTGAGRLSGAGMAEWGRVLITADVVSQSGGRTVLRVAITGDEAPDQTVALVREIGVVGDPEDLTAPMSYRVEASDVPADLPDKPNTEALVLAVLRLRPGDFIDHREIGDVTARWGFPRTKATLLKALGELEDRGTVDRLPGERGRTPDRFGLT